MKYLFCIWSILAALPAAADPWFNHEFGELRSYHADWLDVCAENGDGPCRAVQTVLDDPSSTFFGSGRLALHYNDQGVFSVELFVRGMQEQSDDPVVFDFGTEAVTVIRDELREGDMFVRNVAETVLVIDAETDARLVGLMRAGRWVTVSYPTADQTTGQVRFSLRGVSAALDAITAQKTQSGQ